MGGGGGGGGGDVFLAREDFRGGFDDSDIKPQRKNAGGRKSKQHPYHPHPKPSSVQSAVSGAHQESVSTATKKHARIDHQPS